MSEVWTLLSAALVGTDRAGFPTIAALPRPLRAIEQALQTRPPEEGLLLLAGVLAGYEAAGHVPRRLESTEWYLPAFRPEGDQPPCATEAAIFLEQMLNQRHTDLLDEFLLLVRQLGQRIPDSLLPHLLNHGQKVLRLRPHILPVLGERGRWLASLNPDWAFAAVDLADRRSFRRAWEADPKGRATLVAYLRPHDPALARRLIETTWRTENDGMRRELLRWLGPGISMADEPFLERALDDRDMQVRLRAINLLGMIPESRLVGRMTAAAGSWLEWSVGELSPRFPADIGPSMVRDGVLRPTSAQLTTSERTRLLTQTINLIPPAYWEARFQATPAAIITAVLAGKWPKTLLSALSAAAVRNQDTRWAEALLVGDGFSERTGPVLPILPADVCHNYLAEQIAAGRDSAVAMFLRRWPHGWDAHSGWMLIEFLAEQSTREPESAVGPTLRYLYRAFSRQCPPTLAEPAAALVADLTARNAISGRAWEVTMSALVAILRYRQTMYQALRIGPGELPDHLSV